MPGHWTYVENEAIATDYFDMLSKEIAGVSYNKTEHRRRLAKRLNGRSDGSIELKHQNISAVCLELGIPYIDGYKPRSNYQESLRRLIAERITSHQELLDSIAAEVSAPIVTPPTVDDILTALEEPPKRSKLSANLTGGPPSTSISGLVRPPVNFIDREAANHSLGKEGERFVVAFEQARLINARRERLAQQVEHVAESRGDGLGYDVVSFDYSGRERLIEVKTTRYGKQTPFFVTRNEVRVSEQRREQYHVYRVFGFKQSPRLFTLGGAISESFRLDPAVYVARI